MPNNSFMDGDEIPVRAASYSLVKSYLRQRIENLRGDETPRWDVCRRCSIANSRETFFSFSLFSLFPHEPPLRRCSTGQWVLIDRSLGGPFERRHNAKWREIGGWLVEGGVEEIKEVEKKGGIERRQFCFQGMILLNWMKSFRLLKGKVCWSRGF